MNKPFRILSLSGGGIRGIFQAAFLKELEKHLNEPLYTHFDLICGTSTGSIVGMAVANGISCGVVSEMFKNKGLKIFKKITISGFSKGPIYDQSVLKKELVNVFGNKTLKDAKTKVLVTSANIDRYKHKIFTNFKSFGPADNDVSFVDALLSSSAAPTFFLPANLIGDSRHYVDGGLWANSPSSIGILFANKYLKVPLSNINLLSIDTGDFPASSSIDYFKSLRRYSIGAIKTVFELMFASQASFADQYASEILPKENYIRISAQLEKEIALDDVYTALKVLPALAGNIFDVESDRVIKLLKKVGDSNKGILQQIDRDGLVSEKLIHDAGLTGFYPSRKYYNHRNEDQGTIHGYVDQAKNSLTMISITLVKAINFDKLRTTLERKLESKSDNFKVIISLLNPNKLYLMESLCSIFEKTAPEISADILSSMEKLKTIKGSMAKHAQDRFELRYHNSIPFGSAILIDKDQLFGKIQVETKAYKAPMDSSFAFEVVPIIQDGLYTTLLNGYNELLKDGEVIN